MWNWLASIYNLFNKWINKLSAHVGKPIAVFLACIIVFLIVFPWIWLLTFIYVGELIIVHEF